MLSCSKDLAKPIHATIFQLLLLQFRSPKRRLEERPETPSCITEPFWRVLDHGESLLCFKVVAAKAPADSDQGHSQPECWRPHVCKDPVAPGAGEKVFCCAEFFLQLLKAQFWGGGK